MTMRIYIVPGQDVPLLRGMPNASLRPVPMPAEGAGVVCVADPADADFIFFPFFLDEVFHRLWMGTGFVAEDWTKARAFITSIPLMDVFAEKFVFFLDHDRDLVFNLPSVFFRASLSGSFKDRWARGMPLASDDFSPFGFDSAVRYVCSFQGALNTWPHRQLLPHAFERFGARTAVAFRPNERFHYHYDPARQERMRREYITLLRQSMTVCCPRGTGRNSIRFFETLAMGRIPVLISDYVELPFEDRIPYDDFVIRVPEHRILDLAEYVSAFFESHSSVEIIDKMRSARYYWDRFLRPDAWAASVAMVLEDIRAVRSRAAAQHAGNTASVAGH